MTETREQVLARGVLERLIRAVRTRFADLPIFIRADSAFATAIMINRLDRLNRELGSIDYIVGVYGNTARRRWRPGLPTFFPLFDAL